MMMRERSVLTDCLESLKHVAAKYQEAAYSCDSDRVRETLQDIMFDRVEQQTSVFNLMHQMGMIETEPAPAGEIEMLLGAYREDFARMEKRHHDVEGAHATSIEARD